MLAEIETKLQAESADNLVHFSRKTASNQKKFIAELVHSEYEKYASVFSEGFMSLKTL